MLVLVFVKDMNESVASLARKIDARVDQASPKYGAQKLGTFVIMPDAPGRADLLRSMAQSQSMTRVTFSIGQAPPRYEINPEADVTVLIYTPGRPGQNRVAANFALRQGDLNAATEEEILNELSKVLPK